MKKSNFVLLLSTVVIYFSSCQFNDSVNVEDVKDHLTYFKDDRTNLCFSSIASTNTSSLTQSVSITCVPCDSLKNIKLK